MKSPFSVVVNHNYSLCRQPFCVPCTMKFHFICHVVVPELQMCGYGAQQKNAPDPSSYWGLRDCKYIGEGTTLMLFDTGIDWTHPSFASKGDKLWLLQYKQHQPCGFDEDGHGTMCAGIACGDEYGKPVICRGVAPGAKLGIWKAYTLNGEAGNWANQLAQLIANIPVRYCLIVEVLQFCVTDAFYLSCSCLDRCTVIDTTMAIQYKQHQPAHV